MTPEQKRAYKREYYRKYRETHREQLREWHRNYYKEHPEQCRAYSKRWATKNPEKVKELRANYWKAHKNELSEINKQWRQTHKSKWVNICNKGRKEVSDELKAKGQMFTYDSRGVRERKMVEHLATRCNLSENIARTLLIDSNWNIKQLKQDIKSRKLEII